MRSFSERQSDERREKRRCDFIVVPGVGQVVESAGVFTNPAPPVFSPRSDNRALRGYLF